MPGFRRFFRRSDEDVQSDIDDEIQCHLEMKARDLEVGAMSSQDAMDEALSLFGDVDEIGSQCTAIQASVSRQRARRSTRDAALQELSFAVRALLRRPGFTAAATVTLALGVGANSAMFSVVKTVVLAPLPFEASDRVVQVKDAPSRNTQNYQMSLANFVDYKDLNTTLSRMAAILPVYVYSEREDGNFDPMTAQYVSADLFDMMGVVATAGRTFRAEEDLDGVGRVVVLTHAYWLRKFGGEEVIGRTLTLRRSDGTGGREGNWARREYEIIGVLPSDFRIPPVQGEHGYQTPGAPGSRRVWTQPDVFLPQGLIWPVVSNRRRARSAYVFAELRDGVTPAEAQANLQSIASGILEMNPQLGELEATVMPVGDVLRGEYGLVVGFLWAATTLVLLVACASVSSLLLGWGVARDQELGVRAALGAGARRIFGQLLTEATVLAVAAGALGVVFAYWGIAAIKLIAPAEVLRIEDISLDLGVLGFAMSVSLVTVLLVGLWPAVCGARRGSSEVLKAGSRGATLARTRSLRVLVTTEVALSLVLLAGAGLMLQSFWNLVRVEKGIEAESLIHVDISTPRAQLSKYTGRSGQVDLFLQIKDRVEAIPGVTSVAVATWMPEPDTPSPGISNITPADGTRSEAISGVQLIGNSVSPGYFRTMGIPLLEGRTWDEDWWRTEAGNVAPMPDVISAAMAETFWPGESAVGKIFYTGTHDPDVVNQSLGAWRQWQVGDPRPGPWPHEVIGVVADARRMLGRSPTPVVYQTNSVYVNSLFVRTAVDPVGIAAALRREIDAIDPSEMQVSRVRLVDQVFAEGSDESRFRMLLVVFFAVMATGITCLGLFGVLTYAVAQRTRELGVRVTLGATRSDIATLVLGQGVRMAGLGVAIGLVLVYWVTRYISSLLFGVAPLDPIALLGGAALIFGLALLAAYLPARRAMGVDPIEALRHG